MSDDNAGSHNTEAHTTDVQTHNFTHSNVETLDELADVFDSTAESCWNYSEYGEGATMAYQCAADIVREFRDNLETDIEELREEAEGLNAQINDMASTAEMLEQAEQASDRELAADALPTDQFVEFDGLKTHYDLEGNLSHLEVRVVIGIGDSGCTYVVGYKVDGEVARPMDIDTPFEADIEFDLSALAAIPVANDAVESYVDGVTRTLALPDYAHALYERAENDNDTPEIDQNHVGDYAGDQAGEGGEADA